MTYKWKYVAGGLDVTFNMSNLIAGWNPKRFFNFSLFVGGGANMAFSNDEAKDLAARGYEMAYLWDGTKFRPYFRGGAPWRCSGHVPSERLCQPARRG